MSAYRRAKTSGRTTPRPAVGVRTHDLVFEYGRSVIMTNPRNNNIAKTNNRARVCETVFVFVCVCVENRWNAGRPTDRVLRCLLRDEFVLSMYVIVCTIRVSRYLHNVRLSDREDAISLKTIDERAVTHECRERYSWSINRCELYEKLTRVHARVLIRLIYLAQTIIKREQVIKLMSAKRNLCGCWTDLRYEGPINHVDKTMR